MPNFVPQAVNALSTQFSIVGDITFNVKYGSFQEAEGGPARTVERAPLTDNWFAVGDGRFNPSTLTLDILLTASTRDNAVTQLNNLMSAAETATKIVWGNREREVLGLSSPLVRQTTVTGYRLTLTFLPATRYWLNTSTSQQELA